MEIFASENFGAYEVMEERSCVSGKLGEKITGENISLYQDPLNENGFIIKCCDIAYYPFFINAYSNEGYPRTPPSVNEVKRSL